MEMTATVPFFEQGLNNDWIISSNKQIQMKSHSMKLWLEDLGSDTSDTINKMSDENLTSLIKNLCVCMLEMVSGITGIQAERNQHNDASSRKIPPFLPHQLVTM